MESSECSECSRVGWYFFGLFFSRSFTTRPLHQRTAVLSSVVTETLCLAYPGLLRRALYWFLPRSLTRSQPPSLSLAAHTTPSLCAFLSLLFRFECWLEGQTLESSGLTNGGTRKQQQ